MKPVFLATDLFFYLIVLGLVYISFCALRSSHWRQSLKQMFKHKRYCVSALIIALFMGIALLDSLHFKRAGDYRIYSVLDVLLSPWALAEEKTYSAPFARESAVSELVLKNGGVEQEFPPLNTPGRHWFGTDKVGQDVFYVTLKSVRTGLVIGTVTTLVMLPFALLFGMWAGYFRGWVDDLIQYIYTTLSSIPGILLIAAAVISLQAKIEANPDVRLLILCFILGITTWTELCRLIRGETLKLREAEFIQAAVVLGLKPLQILTKHILPNLMHIVIIVVVLNFSGLVLAEAVLSYVGAGVAPSTYSWGNMINQARLEMGREPVVWWPLIGALTFMFILVFSANLLSEGIQKMLNPKAEK